MLLETALGCRVCVAKRTVINKDAVWISHLLLCMRCVCNTEWNSSRGSCTSENSRMLTQNKTASRPSLRSWPRWRICQRQTDLKPLCRCFGIQVIPRCASTVLHRTPTLAGGSAPFSNWVEVEFAGETGDSEGRLSCTCSHDGMSHTGGLQPPQKRSRRVL